MKMRRTGIAIVVGSFLCLGAAAQSQTSAQASSSASAASTASVQDGQANASLASGTAFNAELNSPVDSKKAKQGDPVTAHSTEAVKSDGKTVIPKGSKVVGHVTQASTRSKGESQAVLGIAFDKAILKNGEEISLSNVAIQAIASAPGNIAAGQDVETMGGRSSSAGGYGSSGTRGTMGGVASTAGGAAGTVTNTAENAGGVAGGTVNSTANAGGSIAGTSRGAVGGLNAAGQLSSNSQGVFGLNGLNLNAAGSNATQGSVITSAGKNVHLDGGTRLLLVSQAGSQIGPTQPSAMKPEAKPEGEKPNKQ